MQEPLRLGIAGLGTVGASVIRLLQRHGDALAAQLGRPVNVAAVSARKRERERSKENEQTKDLHVGKLQFRSGMQGSGRLTSYHDSIDQADCPLQRLGSLRHLALRTGVDGGI